MAYVVGTWLVGTGDPQLQNPNFSRTTTRSALSSLGINCQDEDRVRLPEGLMGAGFSSVLRAGGWDLMGSPHR